VYLASENEILSWQVPRALARYELALKKLGVKSGG
jgi:hypothetical protein